MTTDLSPTATRTETPQQKWVSHNEGIEHAVDPNDPNRKTEGGFRFGGVLFDGLYWLDGSCGPYAPKKETK